MDVSRLLIEVDLSETVQHRHALEPPPRRFLDFQGGMRPSDGKRWLRRKPEVGIVDVMVALSDADNPQKWSL